MAIATLDDLYRDGAPARAFGQTTTSDHQNALDKRVGFVESKLRGRYPDALPLLAPIDPEIVRCHAVIAARDLLNLRGYDPKSNIDINVDARAKEAIAWLDGVQRQTNHPKVTPYPTAPAQRPLPRVTSGTPRGI